MLDRPIITLITDFGLKDPFAGIMKGVISGINPNVQIIDISHNITPHNIFEASQVLSMSYQYFPPSTIHVVVVDPGVGGIRKPLLVVTDNYYFIGPDNGVFTPVYEDKHTSVFKVIHMSSSHYCLPHKGSTFHGRDIFAPAAAWLSKGITVSKFGEEMNDYVTIQTPKSRLVNNTTLEGEIIHIDHFGNAITNIAKENLDTLSPGVDRKRLTVIYKDQKLSISNYYAETKGPHLSVVLNSSGLLELFLYRERASDKSKVTTGDKVSVTLV